MKSLAYLLCCIIVSTTIAQQRFEVSYNNARLDKAVKELTSKYKLKFSFNPKELQKHAITKQLRAKNEAGLISQLFEDLPFDIQLTDGVYLVIPKKIEAPPLPLRGKVFDKRSGEPLAFAHVQADNKGTISNQNGRFTLTPGYDTLTLRVSYIGYEQLELKVPPSQKDVTINLEQNPMILQEVILNSYEMDKLSQQPSFFSLNPKQFNALPTLGETDVFKAIQLLPGIQATDETSSGLSIRGSLPSQNLILMDGFTLYNLDHFFGIYSTLNPNVINNVSVYKGGFGAQYGGRISSVVDVTGKAGNSDLFEGGAGINMLSANAYIQTPIGKRTSLLVGTRQSFTAIINSDLYRDFLASNRQSFLGSVDSDIAELDISPSLRFYDLNGKLKHRFGANSTLDLNLYVSEDNYDGDFIEGDDFSSFNVKDEADWSNGGISLDWKSQFSQKWYSNLVISASEFDKRERLAINQTFFEEVEFNIDSATVETIERNETIEFFDYFINSSINDFTIKSINEIEIDDQNLIKAGAEISSIATSYEADQLLFVDFSEDTLVNNSLDLRGELFNLYAGHQFRSSDFTSNLGIRSSYYNISRKMYLEPRFDIQFSITDKLSLKGAATFHNQFISQNSISALQNTDQFYWVLADDDVIPIQKSTHFILGGNYTLQNWTLDLEYYRKNTTGIIENQFIAVPPDLLEFFSEEEINLSGENTSEGLDLFIKYRKDIFSTWLSYSLGFSENQFWYRNENTPYPSIQDQRHEINLSSIIKLGKWELSSIFLYGSGKPFTPANPDFDIDSDLEDLYDLERINGERLPHYSRLDLSAKYSFALGSLACESGVTAFNVFNRRNIKSRRYAVQYLFDENPSDFTASDDVRVIAIDTYLLGFTPNFFFNIRF